MLSTPREPRLGSSACTHGVRIQVAPRFLPEQSDTDNHQYIFAYHVSITNETDAPVRLMSRRWLIVDSHGRSHEVRGDGVVGQQPRLLPGATHEYSSYCPLPTPWGTMEGEYLMRRDDGATFQACIARFYLVAPRDDDHA
jgi:ApaG protein